VTAVAIARAGAGDIDELLPLLADYCEFYETRPGEAALRALCGELLEHPDTVGIQLVARDAAGAAVGFATLYWVLSTLRAGPIGLMNDLYVAPTARGGGIGRALIDACAEECRRQGVSALEWYAALENTRAQSVYDRTGASRETLIEYELELTS
jgi:GNAT superfamily N-acetyltransferase